MRSCRQQTSYAWLLCLLVVGLVGCNQESDPVFPISGKVSFKDGSVARFGIIEFQRESPTPVVARGKIQKDGTFNVRTSGRTSGLTKGNHKVIIIQVVGNLRGGHIQHDHGLVVADKYRDYETSGLSVEVVPDGKNHFPIIVEPKQRKRR